MRPSASRDSKMFRCDRFSSEKTRRRSLSPFQSYSNESFEVLAPSIPAGTAEPVLTTEQGAIGRDRDVSTLNHARQTSLSSGEWKSVTEVHTRLSNSSSSSGNKSSSSSGSSSTRIKSERHIRGNTLCRCLQTLPSPTDCTSSKLSLVGLDICEIDGVPGPLPARIHTLYISNNLLTTLDGIEQFINIRQISFSNNFIKYLSDLKALGFLHRIEKISLEGNIVTGMPFYRQYLIGLCSSLTVIDGVGVSVEERKHANSYTRQLSAFYDQMRLNELQNIILRHLRLQLTMRTEFQKVVVGKFRSLRREYMPSSYEMQQSSQAGRGQGVSFLLAQCLAGGVYRWLMLSCGLAIDKAVQLMAHRAHLTVLSRLPMKDRLQIAKVPQVGAQHWEAIVAESLKHQQHTRLHLLADCELQRTMIGGSAFTNQNQDRGQDTEILAVLQRLEFEAASLHAAAATQERVELEMRSTSYCGIGSCDHSHNNSSVNNKQGQGQGQGQSKPKARSKGSYAHVSFADASTAGSGDLQALQDEVQSRYLDLLRQVETTGSCEGATAVSGGDLFSQRRQSEADDDSRADGVEEVPPEALKAFLQSAREDLVDLRTLLSVEDQCWATAGPDRKHAHGNPPHPNVSVHAALGDKSEGEREAILGPIPTPLDATLFMAADSVEATASMKVLKGRVDAALLDLSVRRRGEVLSWEANDSLRMGAKVARKAAIDRAEKALQRLDDLSDKIRRARGDVEVAARWTTALQPTISVVEEEKRRVAELRKILDTALSCNNACMSELNERTTRFATTMDAIARAKQALAGTEREVAWELSTDDADVDADADKGITACLSILNAVNKRASVLKRWVLRQLRLHARHRRKLGLHAEARSKSVALRIGRPVFLAWKRLVDVARNGRCVEKWFNRNVIAPKCFRWWQGLVGREQLAREGSMRRLRRRAVRFFHFWRSVARAGRAQTRIQRRRRGAALCFLVKRIFCAWRAHAATCRSVPMVEAADIVRATRYWKAKVFAAWVTAHRHRCDLVRSRGEALARQRVRETLHTALTEWWDIKRTEWFRYRAKRVRVLRTLSSVAALRRRLRGSMRVARHRERTGRLRSSLRHLHRTAQHSAALRRRIEHARICYRSRMFRRCWSLWQQSLVAHKAAVLATTHLVSPSRSRQQDQGQDQHQASPERAQPTKRSRWQADTARLYISADPATSEQAVSGPEVLSAVQLRWNALQTKTREWNLADAAHDDEDDDDDDDDNDYYDGSLKRRFLCKALERWQRFKRAHARLRVLAQCLREQRDWRLMRVSFSSVAAAWARSTRTKTAAMAPASADEASVLPIDGWRDALRADLQAAADQTGRTATRIDESSAQLLDAIDRCDDVRLQVADLEASVSMARREHERNRAAIAQLREESQAVYILAQAFSSADSSEAPADTGATAEACPSAPSTLVVAGPSGTDGAVVMSVGGDPPAPDLPPAYDAMLEESATLAKDREVNADRARTTKLLAQRQQQQLMSLSASASKEASRLRDLADRLDKETLELRGRTAAAAVELIRVEHAIRATQEKDAATVRFHEDLTATLECQRKQALAETEQAAADEKELQAELGELRTKIAAKYRARVSARSAFDPKQLAGTEAAGKELQGLNSAALRSLKSILVDEKNKASHRLSQAAKGADADTQGDPQCQRDSIESLRSILRTSADGGAAEAATEKSTHPHPKLNRGPLTASSLANRLRTGGQRTISSDTNTGARLRSTTPIAKENAFAFNTAAKTGHPSNSAVVGSNKRHQAKAPRQSRHDDDNEISALSLRIRQRLLGGP